MTDEERLAAWRDWAQFVYLGGGSAVGTDDELRAGVCAAHDAALARVQLRTRDDLQIVRDALRYPDIGVHYCRHCDARSPEWNHATSCLYVMQCAETDAARAIVEAALAAALAPQSVAEQIAREAHAGQVDTLTGRPYIEHIERVVALVGSDDEKAVAWLHDVIEDTPWMPADFDRYGIALSVTDAVLLLSRNRGVAYGDYISAILASGNTSALAVKVADLLDHLRPATLHLLTPTMRVKYPRALNQLVNTKATARPAAALAPHPARKED